MIKSFKNAASRKVFEGNPPKKFASLDLALTLRRLDYLDSAASLEDLPPLKSLGLHALSGDRKGQWALKLNGPWRVCFFWQEGNAHEVEIVDYHKG